MRKQEARMNMIDLADVTVHIDEDLSAEQRGAIEASLRSFDGVVSVHNGDRSPHLTVVEYDPRRVDSQAILKRVKEQGAHAQLVGL
jgi:hypothetical protein